MNVKNKLDDSDFEIPILLITFNRLNYTKKVFNQIKLVKPRVLYVSSDGPRVNVDDDVELVKSVRSFIETSIDWDCQFYPIYHEINLGCKYAPSFAINYLFLKEDLGIILEDDTLPSLDFFIFSKFMLKKYMNDYRVMMITGTNYFSNIDSHQPYFFSEICSTWGWATWKRAWTTYDVEISSWLSKKTRDYFKHKSLNQKSYRYLKRCFDFVVYNNSDAWDYQWMFNVIFNSGLCLTPKVNLIENIGVFGSHYNSQSKFLNMGSHDFNQEAYLNYNSTVQLNYEYDLKFYNMVNKNRFLKVFIVKAMNFMGMNKLLLVMIGFVNNKSKK
jgi:hypothetical protein